ncbi:MAG TPA: tellurite resistance/C4-dicarboxylate transporter family protein [Gaiellaceae bacterium]|nr:tellurite resistance/C4-dicarboxylate transporter family protein [Gaiellaceae bacterium]
MRRTLDRAAETLYPGYFNLVMATGIVSNAFFLLHRRALSDAIVAVAAAAYVILLVLLALRVLRYARRLWEDLVDPEHVFMFFTFVAGTDVLGVGLHLRGYDAAATVLWLVALGVWIVLGYFSFSVLTFVNVEEEAEIVHGGWLIAIVGTESLAILGVVLAPRFGSFDDTAVVTVYALWGIGIVLYAIFITLFMRRIFFIRVDPDDMRPLFWVVMGAAAIATNAGSTLVASPPGLPFLRSMRPFVDGTTLVIWAWATWWIPLLVILGVWRHVVRRYPIHYEPAYWNLVFPLGMYTVATYRLSLAADYTALQSISRVLVWVAFAAWFATLVGLLASLRPGGAPPQLRSLPARPNSRP